METRTRMAMIAVENAIAFFDGKRPPTILNPEVLQALTREILKPVIETIVKDELNAKKP